MTWCLVAFVNGLALGLNLAIVAAHRAPVSAVCALISAAFMIWAVVMGAEARP